MKRLLPLLLLASCATAPAPQTGGVHVGETFIVSQSGQAGTGYSWTVTPPAGVTLLDQSSASNAAPGIVGGPVTQTFRFRADAPGSYVLHFSYDRPWTGGEKGAQTADFPVTVR